MSLFNTYSLAAVSRDIVCRRDKEEIISVKKGQHSWLKYLASTRYCFSQTHSILDCKINFYVLAYVGVMYDSGIGGSCCTNLYVAATHPKSSVDRLHNYLVHQLYNVLSDFSGNTRSRGSLHQQHVRKEWNAILILDRF